MTIAASSLLIALLAAPGTTADSVTPSTTIAVPAPIESSVRAISIVPMAEESEASAVIGERFAPRWALDAKRPAVMPAMYAGLGVLQALDVYSTRRAVSAGARETNPLLGSAAKNTTVMLAVKGASTALSIYFAERAWKRNPKGAMILMAVVNGVTAAVVARNMQNAK